jgi:hypothetical protein
MISLSIVERPRSSFRSGSAPEMTPLVVAEQEPGEERDDPDPEHPRGEPLPPGGCGGVVACRHGPRS